MSEVPPAHEAGGELNTAALLARIDERTQNMVRELENVRIDLTNLRTEIATKYVTKDEFKPVRMVVYGMVGALLLAVVAAIVGLVLIVPRHG